MNAKAKSKSPTTSYDAYMGIDPGKEGGIVVLDGDMTASYLMPESDHDLFQIMNGWKNNRVFACLEKVSSSPQMGVASAFTFGQGFGRLSYALTAAEIPFELVTPQKWQSTLNIPKKRPDESQTEHKEKLRQTAQRLFPKLSIWIQPNSLGRQRAIADALLIAHYCRLIHH